MLIETLKSLFLRDLAKLRTEIESYNSDESLWLIDKAIPNSGGNLALHLCGNLSHFMGAQYGKTGYVRNRDLEFSDKGAPREEVLKKIDETIAAVEKGLSNISEAQLGEIYPIRVFAEDTTTEWMLVHLATHLSYHLGQVNYHRRMLDNT